MPSDPPQDDRASPDLLEQARERLKPPRRREFHWAALAAAAFFAVAAIGFAAASILAPPNAVTPPAKTGVDKLGLK
jgi:hypothetical protein